MLYYYYSSNYCIIVLYIIFYRSAIAVCYSNLGRHWILSVDICL